MQPLPDIASDCPDQNYIPTLTFSDIYRFIIEIPTSHGIAVKKFKGLDKSIKRYKTGNVEDIRVFIVEFFITFCIL